MNKYAVITVVDGNFLIRSEWGNKDSAIQSFHSLCVALIGDTGFTHAMVKVLDENLDLVEGKMEYITHEPVTPEPVAEPVEVPEETPAEETTEETPTETEGE